MLPEVMKSWLIACVIETENTRLHPQPSELMVCMRMGDSTVQPCTKERHQ
jgi:hypothetical protein